MHEHSISLTDLALSYTTIGPDFSVATLFPTSVTQLCCTTSLSGAGVCHIAGDAWGNSIGSPSRGVGQLGTWGRPAHSPGYHRNVVCVSPCSAQVELSLDWLRAAAERRTAFPNARPHVRCCGVLVLANLFHLRVLWSAPQPHPYPRVPVTTMHGFHHNNLTLPSQGKHIITVTLLQFGIEIATLPRLTIGRSCQM